MQQFRKSTQSEQRFGGCVVCVLMSFAVFFIAASSGIAGDWAMYRHDPARSGITDEGPAPPLALHWQFKPAHTPHPAWPLPAEELPRLHIDSAHHIAVAEGSAYFGSPVDNKLVALDASTGTIRWTYFAQGPIRFAPVVVNGRVYFGSDDGNIYCLRASDAQVLWRYRAGPTDEKVIGNGRMISLWPVRTGLLLDDGVVFAAAGVFPYEGIYVVALDAETGDVVWKNDTTGDQAHELDYGGICPQGYLVASDDILYVPSGRAMPAAFDRKTGRLLSYLSSGGKVGGTWALLSGNELIAGVDRSGTPAKVAFDSQTGKRKGDVYAWFPGIDMVATADVSYTLTEEGIKAISRGAYPHLSEKLAALRSDQKKTAAMLTDLRTKLAEVDPKMQEQVSQQIDEATRRINALAQQEEADLKALACKWEYSRQGLSTLIVAGGQLFGGGDGTVVAVDAKTGKETWHASVNGSVYGLSASADRLFVSTDQGDIYCFAQGEASGQQLAQTSTSTIPYPDDALTSAYESNAAAIVDETGITKGYCLVIDGGVGRLAYELARRTELKIIVLEEDARKVEEARRRLDGAAIYGSRIVVEQWELSDLPRYFANLVVSDAAVIGKGSRTLSEDVLPLLKPYGGVAYSSGDVPGLPDSYALQASTVSGLKRVIRGELAGAGQWTQQYGDTQNTACSEDDLVQGPLGMLWFGGPGPEHMLERHAKAMSPVSMDGRLFVQGEEIVLAYDAYNGTLLWERSIPGAVRPRADADGGNLSLSSSGLFVAANAQCYQLDPVKGETVRVFDVPPFEDEQPARWAYVSHVDNVLFGSRSEPLKQEYFTLWDRLVRDGKWPSIDEVPAEYHNEYRHYVAKYPVPDERLLADFKRSGALWATMEDFPRWETYASSKGAVTNRMMASDTIFAMSDQTGDVLWRHDGERIAHISISLGEGRLYFAESVVTQEDREQALAEREALTAEGIYRPAQGKGVYDELDVRNVICLDAATGHVLWRKPVDLTGCGGDILGSAVHGDVLLIFANMGSHDADRHQNNTLTWKRITAVSIEDGRVLWSHPNNYRTRPVIVGNDVFIEPRVCDLRTGEIKMRTHPITGEQVPWEYLRPGHTCAVTAASNHALFYRSYTCAFYDFSTDDGLTVFGGIRPGCWINMIPASGVLLAPEASAGCTCSFPLRGSFALVHKPQRLKPWNVFITHGASETASDFAINLGAAGDMKDSGGTVWFAYPNPRTRYAGNRYPNYGVKFSLAESFLDGMGFFRGDAKSTAFDGTDKPWLFASGGLGLTRCEIPLVDDVWDDASGNYTVQLGFAAQSGDRRGQRVFDVKLQGQTVLKNFDVLREAGTASHPVVKEFKGISVANKLSLELIPKSPNPGLAEAPVLNSIRAIREDPQDALDMAARDELDRTQAETLLGEAAAKLAEGNTDEALIRYHAILDGADGSDLKCQALKGLASIGSVTSLSRISRYCKPTDPILRGYVAMDADLQRNALAVHLAIANKLAREQPERAVRMLNEALTIASEELKPLVVASLEKLGVEAPGAAQ